ncbi:GPCR kinase [Tanacetum coccineum]
MACSVSHTVEEIKAMIQKQIDEAKVRQLKMMNLAVEYDNACTAQDDLRKAYEECNDIPQEKHLSSTIPGTIHHKVIGEGGYEKDITVGAALIIVNASIFSSKPSLHYLNITKKNVVKVFRKDTVPESGSG